MKIKSLLDVIDNDFSDGSVKWRLTRDCNFACPYCIQRNCSRRGIFFDAATDYNNCLAVADEVNRIIEEMIPQKINLQLVGGEVTIYSADKLMALLDKLPSQKIVSVQMTTNFHRETEYFERLSECLAQRSITLRVCASWHSEHLSLTEYISKFEHLMCIPNLVMSGEFVSTSENNDEVNEYIERMDMIGAPFIIDGDMDLDKINKRANMTMTRHGACKGRYLAIMENGEKRQGVQKCADERYVGRCR